MPIRPPALDDRSFDDLVAELVARIPAHTPEWTHPRVGDPGRTLLELFAWLGDAILYRANLIPERQRLAFLRLLGIPLRPARPARGIVTISFRDDTQLDAVRLRPLARIEKPMPFEAREEVTVMPVSAAIFIKRGVTAGDGVAPGLADELASVYSLGTSARMYVTEPVFADSHPDRAGVDLIRDTVDRCLWIALFAPKADSQTEANRRVRLALGANPQTGSPSLLNVGFVPAIQPPVDLDNTGPRTRIPHLWEIAAPDFRGDPVYLPLDEVRDTTEGLTHQGIVRLALPEEGRIFRPENDVRLNSRAGVGDRPPRLDDPKLAARLISWIRLRPAPPSATPNPASLEFRESTGGARTLPTSGPGTPSTPALEQFQISWLGINAIEIEQRNTRPVVVLGSSSGLPDQEFALPEASVESETFQLQIEDSGTWTTWKRVDDLAAIDSDPDVAREAPVYSLDSEAGVLRFGDGLRGRIPPSGARLRAVVLRSGGGEAGNLPAGTLKEISAVTLDGAAAPSLAIQQPIDLEGGVDAESLGQAERRIPSYLRHRDRAITETDYRDLAFETPTARVGRVEVLPRFRPQQRFNEVPGVMTVMVLPARPLSAPPNPRADQPFLENVHAWLDRRRPLGTELYVIGCQYRPVGLSTAVTLADGAARDTTLQAIRDTLRRFLWPLAPGGFDRRGWPLGRALSDREFAVEIARVPGVQEVHGVNLFLQDDEQWSMVGRSSDPSEKNITLQPWELPELLAVVVLAVDNVGGVSTGSAPAGLGDPATLRLGNLAPTELRSVPNPFAALNGIPVPVVPDLC